MNSNEDSGSSSSEESMEDDRYKCLHCGLGFSKLKYMKKHAPMHDLENAASSDTRDTVQPKSEPIDDEQEPDSPPPPKIWHMSAKCRISIKSSPLILICPVYKNSTTFRRTLNATSLSSTQRSSASRMFEVNMALK